GPMTLPNLARGGSSENVSANIAGGDAFGGSRSVRVVNTGTLTIETDGGGDASAQGGDGSGTGNGGAANAGAILFEVINATANLRGRFALANNAIGGRGQRGGNAGGGSITAIATNAQINLAAGVGGPGVLALDSTMTGGAGLEVGGAAQGSAVNVTLTGAQIGGGGLSIDHNAFGGASTAASGIGGNATGAEIVLTATNSTLALEGSVLINASATGGAGGLVDGTGGSGEARPVDVALIDTTLTIAPPANSGFARLAVRADAGGGQGRRLGNAAAGRASLALTRSVVNPGLLLVSAQGSSLGSGGQIGGTATGGQARIALGDASTLNAAEITLTGSAITTFGGSARGGTAALQLAAGNPSSLTADKLFMLADATGANSGVSPNNAGQFFLTVNGGNLNVGELIATSRGDAVDSDAPASQLVADGGNINVTGALTAFAFGNLLLRTGSGGIIGSAPVPASTTAIQLDAVGTVEIIGDGSSGGIGGQSIDITAGRSILIGGNLSSFSGPITLTANRGGAPTLNPPPASVIRMSPGTRIDAGTGTVRLRLLDGGGDPQFAAGAISLANIAAQTIDVRHFGTGAASNIEVLAGAVLSASGPGRAIDLAALGGEVINLAGDAGLVLTGGGHYAIFAATPTGSQIGSFANYLRRYNVANAAAYDQLDPGGNFAAFRIAPVLTVTANDASRFYGSANPAFTASFAGFLPGDGVGDISGAAQLTTLAGLTSGIGTFAIDASLGSLLSAQGYQFVFAPGILSITPRPITVTANNATRIYGNANPSLTFVVGGQGLVNGDQLTGALATAAGLATGIGNVAITQGTLAASANYALTFAPGILSITARPLTLTADDLSKLLGLPDPPLTVTISGDGLVNGDQLSGALVRDPGERIGQFAIRRGTLGAGDNYAVTFIGGTFTIDAPPAPPEITNPTLFDYLIAPIDTRPSPRNEDDERFGIDFPDQPEAPLIVEDPLLDDPVTSGGDASIYGGGAKPPAGDK
ncbi:MAG: hypothetical protein KAF27_03095, partial [Porphyrobacter sp.]|nr:hypothetical protein [Porphyrobacter sp.]